MTRQIFTSELLKVQLALQHRDRRLLRRHFIPQTY